MHRQTYSIRHDPVMKNSTILLLAQATLCIFVLAAGVEADAATPRDELPSLRFNVSPNGYPPYLIVEPEQTSGIIWDVMDRISSRLGYRLVARKVPRKRVDQMLLDGFIDATSRAREWTENPEQFLFTDPVVQVEEVLFVPSDTSFEFRQPEDLFSRTLITHLGYYYPELEPYFRSRHIRRFDVSRDRDMFTYLRYGKQFDAVIADRLVGQWILRKEGLQGQFRISGPPFSRHGLRIMLRRDWQAFALAFNRELAHLRENGELEAILANYR